LSIDQYRAGWNLSREHPTTAPSYPERRSGLAKQLGLGLGRRSSREEPEPVVIADSTATAISAARKAPVGDDLGLFREAVIITASWF
jgi:ROS/MUCR transcriptional regulator protein